MENGAKAPLVLDYVRFDPTPGLLAAPVVRSSSPAEAPDQEPLDEYVQSLQVLLLSCLMVLCPGCPGASRHWREALHGMMSTEHDSNSGLVRAACA